MNEIGIDISRNKADDVNDFIHRGKRYNYTIAVCDYVHAEQCPIFPRVVKRLHWSFPNPAEFTGIDDEILAATRSVRDQIKGKVIKFIDSFD